MNKNQLKEWVNKNCARCKLFWYNGCRTKPKFHWFREKCLSFEKVDFDKLIEHLLYGRQWKYVNAQTGEIQ